MKHTFISLGMRTPKGGKVELSEVGDGKEGLDFQNGSYNAFFLNPVLGVYVCMCVKVSEFSRAA